MIGHSRLRDGSFRAVPHIRSNGSQVLTDNERSWEQRQLDTLMQEIAERLRPICAQMPAEEFDELVERIARVQRRWQQAEARDFLSDSPRQSKELE
jgi:prophage antirepressor-like protein